MRSPTRGSTLVEHALRCYLRVQEPPCEEATPEEFEAIERGAEIARGDVVTFEEIKREPEADLLKERAKKSKNVPTEDRRRIDRALDQLLIEPLQGDVRPLRNQPAEFRLRVGDFRILRPGTR